MNRRVALALVVFAPALLLASCSSGSPKPVYPVHGEVRFEGQPVNRALVVFHPLSDSAPEAVRPRGQVGEDGSFTLSTFGTNDGAPAGEYAVTVEWWLTKASKSGNEGADAPARNRLPPRYSNPQTSQLRAQIKEGDNQLPAFQLRK